MEKLKDIFNNIKDRFSNPLFFSFFCAWLTCNWQITVCLFWYDPIQISKTGCNNIFEFINDKINPTDSLLNPLGFALVYTIVMPIVKNLISAFYSWTEKWGENWNLKIKKGIKIPFEKYLKFREDYDSRSKILEDIISKESSSQLENNKSKTELLQVKARVNELEQTVTATNEFINQFYDVNIINGYWTNKYTDSYKKELNGSEEVYIDNGKYFTVEKFGRKELRFNIKNFHFDTRNNSMFFIKERVNQEEVVTFLNKDIYTRFNPNNLQMESNDLLVGFENGTTQIEYRKKDISLSVPQIEHDE